jgi:excisionase family DNA binding protein
MTDQYLTVKELAELIKIPEQTVYHWRKIGRGPHGVRFGRHLRFPMSEVNAYTKDPEGYERTQAAKRKAAS